MPHVALLGDSIFDNSPYTRGEPDVVTHLRTVLPAEWKASLLAVDGSVCQNLPTQIAKLTPEMTHVVVSIGGNDALQHLGMTDRPVHSTQEALLLFGSRAGEFEAGYRKAVRAVVASGRPARVCTIYNGNFRDDEARVNRVALMLFNDAIVRVAFENKLPIIDLRSICTRPEDYANPIEPSGLGGLKIARAIASSLAG